MRISSELSSDIDIFLSPILDLLNSHLFNHYIPKSRTIIFFVQNWAVWLKENSVKQRKASLKYHSVNRNCKASISKLCVMETGTDQMNSEVLVNLPII